MNHLNDRWINRVIDESIEWWTNRLIVMLGCLRQIRIIIYYTYGRIGSLLTLEICFSDFNRPLQLLISYSCDLRGYKVYKFVGDSTKDWKKILQGISSIQCNLQRKCWNNCRWWDSNRRLLLYDATSVTR